MHLAAKTLFSAATLLAVFVTATGCDNEQGKSNIASASASGLIVPDEPPIPSGAATADARLPPDDDLSGLGEGGAGEGGSAVVPNASASSVPSSPPPVSPTPKAAPKQEPKAKAEPKPNPGPADPPKPVAKPAPEPAPATAKKLDAPKAGSADEKAQKLDTIFAPVQLFRARFKQSYSAKIHGTKKNSEGILYVKKPGKLSLSYHDPNKNRAVSDGETLKVYEHDNKQMFVKKVKNTEYPGAFSFILGKGLRQSFTFTFHKTSKWEGGAVLVGTPRTPNPGYKQVLFYVDDELLEKGDLGAIRRVLVIDAQGNRNRFDFVHAEQPDAIPDKWFQFEPPAGTEIIKS